jgi:prefoldin subunit 5
MITLDALKERKETILEDIEKVEAAIRQLDEQRVSLQANLYALQGAAQQVDFFMIDEDVSSSEKTRKNKNG